MIKALPMPDFSITLLCVLLAAFNAYAAKTSCPVHFAAGEAPEFTNQKLAASAFAICCDELALMFSGVSHTVRSKLGAT